MNNATAAPESATPTKTAIRLATAFGLGYAPVAPGTAGSLGGVALFALLLYTLEGVALDPSLHRGVPVLGCDGHVEHGTRAAALDQPRPVGSGD